MIKYRNLHSTLKTRIDRGGYDIPRNTYHAVKSDAENLDYLQQNLPAGTVFNTVTDAVAAAEDFDEVVVWPGEWTEAATINITKDGLRLRGAGVGSGPAQASSELWQYAGTDTPVITVAAKGVEICGLQILPYAGANLTTSVGIAVGLATESKYCWIHDNYLRAVAGANMPSLIVVGTASTADAQMCMIENNYFRQGGSSTGASAQIYMGQGTGSTIRNNNFLIAGNSTNYKCVDMGTALVQRTIIQDNLFMAFEAGGCQAIDEGTGSTTDGHIYVDGNHFIGFTASTNCFEYNADNAGLNYLGTAAITS